MLNRLPYFVEHVINCDIFVNENMLKYHDEKLIINIDTNLAV